MFENTFKLFIVIFVKLYCKLYIWYKQTLYQQTIKI